ncbi:MAG: hypothetical protein A4E57_03307 [Syntrophorhabdaceae bacterium PtaU1.Bin034]|nr:MAG: hypothetical protein A4E57_03307 [Syntrophorhabdaceae bacterium PtaU1.Bin034]
MISKVCLLKAFLVNLSVTFVFAPCLYGQVNWAPIGTSIPVPITSGVPRPGVTPPPPLTPMGMPQPLPRPGNTVLGTTGISEMLGTMESGNTVQITSGTEPGGGELMSQTAAPFPYSLPPTDTEMALAPLSGATRLTRTSARPETIWGGVTSAYPGVPPTGRGTAPVGTISASTGLAAPSPATPSAATGRGGSSPSSPPARTGEGPATP